MNFIDAVKMAQAELIASHKMLWFRPTAWRGNKRAYSIDPFDTNGVIEVPSNTISPVERARIPSVSKLLDEWELVDPCDVLEER